MYTTETRGPRPRITHVVELDLRARDETASETVRRVRFALDGLRRDDFIRLTVDQTSPREVASQIPRWARVQVVSDSVHTSHTWDDLISGDDQ